MNPVTENKYYTSITEIPLKNYVDCLVQNNLSHLIISGNPDNNDLALAWHEMQNEYIDAIGNETYDLYLTLAKEIGLLKIKLAFVENCVAISRCIYNKTYTDKINEVLRTNFAFDWNDQKKFKSELDQAMVRSKSIVIQIKLKESQIEGQEKKFNKPDSKPTWEYFQSILITLSDHAKYEIRDTITVYQFADRIRRLNEYCAHVEKEKKK